MSQSHLSGVGYTQSQRPIPLNQFQTGYQNNRQGFNNGNSGRPADHGHQQHHQNRNYQNQHHGEDQPLRNFQNPTSSFSQNQQHGHIQSHRGNQQRNQNNQRFNGNSNHHQRNDFRQHGQQFQQNRPHLGQGSGGNGFNPLAYFKPNMIEDPWAVHPKTSNQVHQTPIKQNYRQFNSDNKPAVQWQRKEQQNIGSYKEKGTETHSFNHSFLERQKALYEQQQQEEQDDINQLLQELQKKKKLNEQLAGEVSTQQSVGQISTLQAGGEVARLQSGGEVSRLQSGGEVSRLQSGGEVSRLQSGGEVSSFQTGPQNVHSSVQSAIPFSKSNCLDEDETWN